MLDVSVKELLEAGSHFGHQVSRWNPKMRPYIFATKGGIHILDLDQTVVYLKKACQFVADTVANGGAVLFVGTKKQAKTVIEEEAKRSGQFFVSNRWLGGLLTNFKTIRASLERLENLEKQTTSPDFEKFTKKERLDIQREIEKLNSVLGGIRGMTHTPACLFLVDTKKEEIAKREANRLKIPVVAIVDTNSDPQGIDFVIPANDDALRSIQVITKAIADAAAEGTQRRQVSLAKDAGEEKPSIEAKPGPLVSEREIETQGRAYVGRGRKGEEETVEDPDLERFARAKAEENAKG